MKTCVIACSTIKEELQMVYRKIDCKYPIYWIESGLHNYPNNLHRVLQKHISEAREYDRILLGMGYCGNSVAGISSENSVLIIPRVDDCISLMLGSVKRRRNVTKDCGTYFFTKGWLSGEKNMWVEYQYAVRKFGIQKAKEIMKMMLCHYKRLGIVDLHAYPLEDIIPETVRIAQELELNHEVIPGDDSYLKRLLNGPWDEEHFLIVKPGNIIVPEDLLNYY